MKRVSVITVALLALLNCRPAVWAGEQSADAVLKSKGLTRVGVLFLLDADANLTSELKEIRQARAQLNSNQSSRGEIERQLRAGRQAQAQLYDQEANLRVKLMMEKDAVRHNELAGQLDLVHAQIRESELYISNHRTAAKRYSISLADYIKTVNDLSDRMAAMLKQYRTLSTDPETAGALGTLNAAAHVPLKLGPSVRLLAEVSAVEKERQRIQSAAIKFELEGGVPVVHVTLNGTLAWTMVLDSGASDVTLTYEVAQQLGMQPEPSDTMLRLQSANGRVTMARLKTLKSLKLGPFTEQDVECVVLPENVAGTCLLGETFLSRFVYQMDLSDKEINLWQLGAKLTTDQGKTQTAANQSPPAPRTPVPPAPQQTKSAEPQFDQVEWTDLLKGIDTDHAVSGKFMMVGNKLAIAAGASAARLKIPIVPGDKYELRLSYERPDQPPGEDGMALLLPVGTRPAAVIVRAHDIGLDMVGGKRYSENQTTKRDEFPDGRPHELDVKVMAGAKDARIIATVDGRPGFDWTGPLSELSMHDSWNIPAPFTLGIGSWQSSYIISSLQLRTGAAHEIGR